VPPLLSPDERRRAEQAPTYAASVSHNGRGQRMASGTAAMTWSKPLKKLDGWIGTAAGAAKAEVHLFAE
jgi:hypothetical protein